MKKIKVHYCKYGNTNETTPRTFNFFVHNILTKYYDVEVTDVDPEYVFFFESTYEHLQYKNAIRIFNTGENVSPNFNICDYATGIDYISFEDRYYRLPPYFIASVYSEKDIELAKSIDFENPKVTRREDLAKKTEFCSFVYSNYLADDRRKELFDAICSYKKVNSGGKYINNVGGPVKNKVEFELKHKFCMAIENSCRDGYTTDRIVNAFMANAIPIYWGNPAIGREFNTKRFINCHDYESFDKVVERIKEIDNDDELYLRIVNEPIFAEGFTFEKVTDGFEAYLKHVFDQPLAKAPRRTLNMVITSKVENNERIIAKYAAIQAKTKKTLASIYRPLKSFKALENFKQWYFRNRLK